MTHYRVYRLDSQDHIVGADWIEAEDDVQALSFAQSLSDGSGWEVWQGGRKLEAVLRQTLESRERV